MTDRLDAILKSTVTKFILALVVIVLMSGSGVLLFQQFVTDQTIVFAFAILWGSFCGLVVSRHVERLIGLRK